MEKDKIWTAKEAANILECPAAAIYGIARRNGIEYFHPAMFSDEDLVKMGNGYIPKHKQDGLTTGVRRG